MFERSRDRTRPAEADILGLLFEELRAPGEPTPAPGFYERVCSQIQEMAGQSIWVPFIYSRFPSRFVTACLALALAAFSYVFGAGWNTNDPIFSSTNPAQQRDAVLTQIVTYRKPN